MKPTVTQLARAACMTSMMMLSGCTTPAPNLDMALGKNLNTIKAMQTLNPNASANNRTATLDGVAARDVLVRYNDSYRKPTAQPNVFTIGIGK